MNIYDMYLNVSKEATKQEKEYAERFLLRNEDNFGYIEGRTGMKILLGNIREAQKNGVMIEIDSIWKRCPYETYEDVTNRYIADGKVKDSIYCEVDGYKWEFDYPDRREYEMEK